MDPNAALSDLLDWLTTLGDDIRNGEDEECLAIDRSTIVDRCDELSRWIAKGGFPPCVAAIVRMHYNEED